MTGIHDRRNIDREDRNNRKGTKRRNGAVALLVITALLVSACGSRLSGSALAAAKGGGNGGAAGASGTSDSGSSGSGTAGATGTAGSTAKGTGGLSGGTAGSAGTSSSGGSPSGGAATGTTLPAGGNGGATAVGVTGTTITVGNITSISGVAPGLTQSAQQATQAWAAYENSQGGINGRQIKVQTFDDGNDSGQDYADASQACASDFAMVGNASGFDDGGATAVAKCGIPEVAAEVSTTTAGNVPQIFGASPGNAHYWSLGPANYLKAKYPSAVTKAAMIYLNVPATADQAPREMKAYTSVGFNYIYTVSATPTQSSYGPIVLAMQQKGVKYVTEYSDQSSAARLLQAMQQQNFTPQVVDWFGEEYSPDFINQTQPASNGDLVLMATAAYEEAGSNPGMQLYLQWLNRVAPGAKHDIFGAFAWSAGLAFAQAAKAAGPHLTRARLLAQLAQIHNWTGGGVQPPADLGNHVPSACFSYFTMQGSSFNRTYPAAANTFDCTGGLAKY
jgi:ABC-type branched-subunit amino acid transport system substrate-binding protein